MIGVSSRFSAAIVRLPSPSCVRGLRATDRGDPNYSRFRRQHRLYIAALSNAGLNVTTLPPNDAYPDAVFVEDPALCLPDCAILLRPGTPSRRREPETLASTIQSVYGNRMLRLPDTVSIEGGDILVTDREVVVGQSARTDAAGASALAELLGPLGYAVRGVQTPSSVLHLKTDCATLGDNQVLATRRLAESGGFDGYDVVLVPDDEEAAANAVRLNDTVLLAQDYPRTQERLVSLGFSVVTVPVSEAAKLDGGLSCMSLRYALAQP